jgi:hypothetical protein
MGTPVIWVVCDMLIHWKDDIRLRRGGLIAALGITISVWVQNGARSDEPAESATASASHQVSLDDLSETRDRPLFSPSRRPRQANLEVPVAPPPPPPPPQAPTPVPNLAFLGTFESPTEVGATVQIPPNDKPVTVRYGTAIGGWRVVDISRQRLVLGLEDRRAVFTLFTASSTANGEAPGALPPTGQQFRPPPSVVPVPSPPSGR